MGEMYGRCAVHISTISPVHLPLYKAAEAQAEAREAQRREEAAEAEARLVRQAARVRVRVGVS